MPARPAAPTLIELGPEVDALLDAARDLASTLELKPLLDVLLDHLRRLVDYAGTSIRELDGAELAFLGCVSTILRKLQLVSRTQAALYAIREGIAPLERTDTSD